MNMLWNKKNENDVIPDSVKRVSDRPYRKVWAVGGGKGGVGKSLIAANLGIMLARESEKVVLVDLDLGGANLHTCLGVDLPKYTLSDFIQRHVDSLEQLIVPT
ncbi:MAG: P-loop NTPase, partial [bacterium]